MKLGLVLLASLSLALMGILTGITTTHNDEIEDLQAQIEVLEEQIEQQQDYIEEVHSYINDYTYKDGGRVFVYIDDEGNYFD